MFAILFREPSSHCCHRTHKNGSTTYFHAAVTPVLVAPGLSQVISLEPEFITPQDGHNKQDCENVAAKRWLQAHWLKETGSPITLLGDDLYILLKLSRRDGRVGKLRMKEIIFSKPRVIIVSSSLTTITLQ